MHVTQYKKNDEYYTPLYAVVPIEKYLKRKSRILCPFDTNKSRFVKYLSSKGHNVIHTHISEGKDFFKLKSANVDYIISNPPYSKRTDILTKSFEMDIPFAMLLSAQGLFESNRFELFQNNTFEIMYMNKRIAYYNDTDLKNVQKSPPFSSVYVCHNILPRQIIFEEIERIFN